MQEILARLGFNWQMALANLVNFLIIFWILKKFAWAPIKKTLKERQDKIDKGLEDAEKAAAEVTMAKENYDKKMEEAKQEANEIIARASEQGKQVINKATEFAQIRSERIITDAKELIKKEKDSIMTDIRQQTVEIAFDVAEKILKREVSPKDTQRFVNEIIAKEKKGAL